MRHIERNTDVRIKCFKCGNQYLMNEMRMDPSGKNLACNYCLNRQTPPSKAVSTDKKASPIFPGSLNAKKPGEKISYFCKNCKYSFTRASHMEITSCPYCSASGTLSRKGTADSIVREVTDMDDDEGW